MDTTSTVIESQLDWLTCAAHTERGADEFAHLAQMFYQTTELPDAKPAPFRLKGYEGWQAGRVRFGARPGAAIIQLSGDLARAHFDTLYPLADSISRLDIAVTARLSQPDPFLGSRSYREAAHWYGLHPQAARPEQHSDADGGYTCYIGNRSSDWFLRVYNKEAESRDDAAAAERYRNSWRYELECKGGTCGVLAAEIAARDGEDRAADIQSMLHEYCTHHGITPPFPHAGGAKLVPGFRRRSDRDSKLAWLAKSVAPAVSWLRDTGDIADIYQALGLSFGIAAEETDLSADAKDG